MNPETKPIETPATAPLVTTTTAPTRATPRKPSGWLPVIVLVGVFLVGFVPMWLKTSQLKGELFRAQQELRILTIQTTFADAALDARRGDYEPARQRMVNFFALVTTEQDRGIVSVLPVNASESLKSLLAQRDQVITLLARGDPASAERLATAYAEFRKGLNR